MSEEIKKEMPEANIEDGDNSVVPRPPIGTYNSYENEYLSVLHLIKYNLHFLGKSTVFAAALAKSSTVDEAIMITEKVVAAFREADGVK